MVEIRNLAAFVTLQQLELQLQHPQGFMFPVTLDYRRAIFLPESKRLLISDLHWGKGEIFRKHGIPVPFSAFEADLQSLSGLLHHYSPEQILVLGDLIHGKTGLTEPLIETVCAWRKQYPNKMILVAGNHDRAVESLADACEIDVLYSNLKENCFLFSHHPWHEPGFYTWCGHIHPTIRLTSATDMLRLPCFHLTANQGTLPAFSSFTGGYNVKPQPTDHIVAISANELIPISL